MAVRPTTKRPGHTCPDIDAFQRALRELINDLEDFRSSNAELRKNGEDWEAYALDLEDKLAAAENRIAELESESSSV